MPELSNVGEGSMGKAWPPGAAEHVTTARGDRTDGHFGFAPFRRHGSSVVHTPCWRSRTNPLLACSLALERVAPGGMGRAWPPGAAEHVTTARGDRTDGHFGFDTPPDGSSVVHTPCWRNVSKPLLACSLALERVAPGGMGRAWPPGAAEHVMTARGKTRTARV